MLFVFAIKIYSRLIVYFNNKDRLIGWGGIAEGRLIVRTTALFRNRRLYPWPGCGDSRRTGICLFEISCREFLP
jgi:hypothetical protein